MLFGDRVRETTTSTGTGNVTLAGPTTGFQSFNAAFGTGSLPMFTYGIIAVDGSGVPTGDWEVGEGHLSASSTLVRDSVLANSAGNTSLISFSAGTKVVIGSHAASYVARCVRRLYVGSSAVGNGADTTEDVLQTYTMPAGTMRANGETIRITAYGTMAATSNSRNVRVYFGSTVVNSALSQTTSSITVWRSEVNIMRTGVGAQVRSSWITLGNGIAWFGGNSTLAEDDTAAITLKVTGQNTTAATANSVVCNGFIVELIP
jgi:hypothetical protein